MFPKGLGWVLVEGFSVCEVPAETWWRWSRMPSAPQGAGLSSCTRILLDIYWGFCSLDCDCNGHSGAATLGWVVGKVTWKQFPNTSKTKEIKVLLLSVKYSCFFFFLIFRKHKIIFLFNCCLTFVFACFFSRMQRPSDLIFVNLISWSGHCRNTAFWAWSISLLRWNPPTRLF